MKMNVITHIVLVMVNYLIIALNADGQTILVKMKMKTTKTTNKANEKETSGDIYFEIAGRLGTVYLS